MKTYLRLALFCALIQFAALSIYDIAELARHRIPNNFPAPFHGSPSDWGMVAINVFGGATGTGLMVALFLTLSGWDWPQKLDRWLARIGNSH